MRWLLLSLLSACATPLCVTHCGLVVEKLPKGWSCEDARETELQAYKAFAKTKDKRLTSCNLTRFTVNAVEVPAWWSFGTMVNGVTYCENGQIVIGSQPPADSALVHEIAHALQNCEPLDPQDATEGYHANWKRDGIYDAIEAARSKTRAK